ncbi:MAG: hypothetical protein WCQ32_01325 [bacterium]
MKRVPLILFTELKKFFSTDMVEDILRVFVYLPKIFFVMLFVGFLLSLLQINFVHRNIINNVYVYNNSYQKWIEKPKGIFTQMKSSEIVGGTQSDKPSFVRVYYMCGKGFMSKKEKPTFDDIIAWKKTFNKKIL